MNILFPNHFPLEGSGSGIYTQNIAKEFATLGHKVMTITPEHKAPAGYPFKTKGIIFKSDNTAGCEVDFNFPCFSTHPVSNNTYYELTDRQIGTYVDIYQKKIEQGIKEINADIIHCGHIWVAPYCASRTDIPYVITCHGTDLLGFKKDKRFQDMAIQAVEKAQRIIAISRQIKEQIIEIFPQAKDKIKIIYNGFDAEIFNIHPIDRIEVLRKFSLPEYRRIISFVGKLTHFKGVDTLLKAAEIYENRLDSTGTLIVGQGELREELEKLMNELNLKNIHFLGHQNQKVVSDLYNLADLSVVPSRKEAFGLVAIEALACGTPVVGTNDGGLPDFINEKVGALVEPDSPERLADKIMEELKSEAKKIKGGYCHKYAHNNFLWSNTTRELEKIYNNAV